MSDNTRSDFWSEDPFNGRSLSFDGTERFDTPPRDETSPPSAKRLRTVAGAHEQAAVAEPRADHGLPDDDGYDVDGGEGVGGREGAEYDRVDDLGVERRRYYATRSDGYLADGEDDSSDSDASTAVHDNGDYWSEALTEDEDHRMQASYKPLYVRDDDLEIERRRYNEKR